jgi:preprotein translocase subunit Sss1
MKPSLKDWIGFLIPALIGLTIYGFIGYVIFHFIAKYW